MFSRLLNSIRESITRGGSNNRQVVNDSNKTGEHSSTSEYTYTGSRRPSVVEELQNNDTHSMFSTSQSLPANRVGRNNSIAVSVISEPIPIDESASKRHRRRNSVFGISNVTADDYVQKDLVSSSWS
jgi:hypothetical protein